jgi:hypothetical protein
MKSAYEKRIDYRNVLSVYLNLATDNVDIWLKKLFPDERISEIKNLNFEDESEIEYGIYIFESAKSHFFFLNRLYENEYLDYFKKPNDETTIVNNYPKLMLWINLLYDLRNYWTHVDHDKITLTGKELKELNEILINILYLEACNESKTKIPEQYENALGINIVKKVKIDDDNYEIEGITDELSITGIIFYACLFLDGKQINDFFESMTQSRYSLSELNERMYFRKKNPDVPYPEKLTKAKKDFLHACDVYRYWQLRGHRANIVSTYDLDAKESCFGMLEYLKRCPKEYLDLNNPASDKNSEIIIDDKEYSIRQKDKFFDWMLAFWDEEMQCLDINGWQWARHQTTEKIKETKKDLEKEAKENGCLYHFPRYQKVLFDIPENEEERLNYNRHEYGFPYFLLKDDNSDKATNAMFRYKNSDDEMVIGLMNSRLLCSVFEWYLYKFPINGEHDNNHKKEFWKRFFNACYAYIASTQRITKQKTNVTKEQIEKRIKFLRAKYDENPDNMHRKLQYILDTWNQIISYGCDTNMEHANDFNGRLGAKNGYQKLLTCLSLMNNSLEERRKQTHRDMINILKQLGMLKSKESYFTVINNAFIKCRITNSPFPLNKATTIEEHFDLCKNYRIKILKSFEENLAATFDVDKWRPAYEMRWMGLSDARTPQAARPTSIVRDKKPLNTNIINVDNGSYPAVGLPRDVRHLMEQNWQDYLIGISNGCLESPHAKIYPSPNDCTLVIPEFYKNAEYKAHDENSAIIYKRKRLYLIRRQDTVISHIAYKKWCEATRQLVEGWALQSFDYQRQKLDLPVGKIFIRFSYRYFKQNRYQLSPELTERICNLLVKRHIVNKGDIIDFNNLVPADKSVLTVKEQYIRLLSKEEQMLSAAEKEKLREERFNRMNSLIFYPSTEKGKLYFDEILQNYIICRRVIIDKIHELEHKCLAAKIIRRKPSENRIGFAAYTKCLVSNGYINEEEQEKLRNIYTSAFHGNIPDEENVPKNLIAETKDKKQYFDYFGEGITLINKILGKLPKTNYNNVKRQQNRYR